MKTFLELGQFVGPVLSILAVALLAIGCATWVYGRDWIRARSDRKWAPTRTALAAAAARSPREILEATTPRTSEVVRFLEEILSRLRAAAAEGDFLVGWPLIAESRYFGDPAAFRRIMLTLKVETLAETLGSQRADEVAFFYGNGDGNDLRTVRAGELET